MHFALFALLLASTNTVATANQVPQPAEGGAAVEKAKEPRKICKKPDTTGSRLSSGKKICMTAEQWRKADQ